MFQSPFGKPRQQRIEIGRSSITEADLRLDLAQLVGSGVLSIAILSER